MMTLPWDDPNAYPLADIRRVLDNPPERPPGEPVLVPQALKDMLAGQVPDNHLVAYPSRSARAGSLRQRLAECQAHDDDPPVDQSNCPLPHTSQSYAEAMDRHLRMAVGLPPPETSQR